MSLFVADIGWKPLKIEHCILVNELHYQDLNKKINKGTINQVI